MHGRDAGATIFVDGMKAAPKRVDGVDGDRVRGSVKVSEAVRKLFSDIKDCPPCCSTAQRYRAIQEQALLGLG